MAAFDPRGKVLAFDVGELRLALPAGVVREVVRAVATSRLPRAPTVVEGVVNFRGVLVPVLDIRHRFGLAPAPLTPEQHLLIAEAGPRLVALRVDRAVDLVSVDPGAVEPVTRVAPGAEDLVGIARLPDGLLMIQDIERFLSLEEGEEVDASLARAAPGPGGP